MHRNGSRHLVRLACVAALLLSIGCSSSEEPEDDRPSRADCEAARAHQARLAIAAGGTQEGDARSREELAKHQANLATVGGPEAIDRCVATDSKARLRCVLAATTGDEAARCAAERTDPR
jgi:hypothetical protein